jgi:hypothetical protein
MADFLLSQLDFIYFFYGLAFFSVGTACFAISRGHGEAAAWLTLGAFALLHGACEWLDLAALVAGDQLAFAFVRVALNTASFMLLAEFGRLESERLGRRPPGRWIYGLLGLVVLLGAAFGGPSAGGAISRYLICFPAALLASWVFFMQADGFFGRMRRLALVTSLTLLVYAAAAGLVPPQAPFWPASIINDHWFVRTTGVPIQLVRGALALVLGYVGWVTWSRLVMSELRSDLYTMHAHRQYLRASIALAATLVCGWVLTDYLGDVYRRHAENEARGGVELLASRLNSDTSAVDALAKALAGSPSVSALLTGGREAKNAASILDMDVRVSGAEGGAIYNRAGVVIALSRRPTACLDAMVKDFPVLPAGGRIFALSPDNRSPYYCTGAPIVSRGVVVGAAVLELSLAPFAAALTQVAQPSFMIDGDGVVMASNRPQMLLQALWPLASDKGATLAARYGRLNTSPLAARKIDDGAWVDTVWRRAYMRRRLIANGPWSLVIMTPPTGVVISRMLGIGVTFMVIVLGALSLLWREHMMRGRLHMSRRLKAQKLAHDRATLATLALSQSDPSGRMQDVRSVLSS